MKLKFIAALFAIAMIPVCADAQQGGAAKVTNADAQRVVKLISGDKAKTKIYCDMTQLGDEIDQADQKKDTKKVEELSAKMDEMAKQLGPDYVAFSTGLQDMDPDSKEGKAIAKTLEALDDLCGK